MSHKIEDKIPEFQSSFVQSFLKAKLGKDALISTNYRKEYSKCLSLFLYYLATIARHGQGDSKKKITKLHLEKALTDIGFEDFAEQLHGWKKNSFCDLLNKKYVCDFVLDMQIDFKPAHQIQSQRRHAPEKADDSTKDNQIQTENGDDLDENVHNLEGIIGEDIKEHLQNINLNHQEDDDVEDNIDSDDEEIKKQQNNDVEQQQPNYDAPKENTNHQQQLEKAAYQELF